MQDLMVLGFIVDEILRVGLKNDFHKNFKQKKKNDKVTGA